MRNETEMFELILSVAKNDKRIRAVILNGSRVNNKIEKDEFQDFDIIYLVHELESFQSSPNWIDIFGERIILQLPNSMTIDGSEIREDEIIYLMLFKDFNRIDLTLTLVENRLKKRDSLTKILLDKDDLFINIPTPTDKDYWIRKPSQQEFSECCNEFWWVSTYIVKALVRNEIIYSKALQDNIVRKMFMKVIAWNIAVDYDFKINLGVNYRFLKNYIETSLMTLILKTYSSTEKLNIWNSLVLMADMFYEKSKELAIRLDLEYNLDEANNVKEYIQIMKLKYFVNEIKT